MKKKILIIGSLLLAIIIGYIIYTVLVNKAIELDGELYSKIGNIGEYEVYERDDQTCVAEIEKVYQDNEYTYFFDCLKSDHYLLEDKDGDLLSIIEVIVLHDITIEKIMKVIPGIKKYEKTYFPNPKLTEEINFDVNAYELIGPAGDYQLYVKKDAVITVKDVSDHNNIEFFYQDEDGLNYYLRGFYSHYYLVVKDNEAYYLPHALESGKILIDDLETYQERLQYFISF